MFQLVSNRDERLIDGLLSQWPFATMEFYCDSMRKLIKDIDTRHFIVLGIKKGQRIATLNASTNKTIIFYDN